MTFTEFAILRKIAARLAHNPYGNSLNWLTPAGAEEKLLAILEVLLHSNFDASAIIAEGSRARFGAIIIRLWGQWGAVC